MHNCLVCRYKDLSFLNLIFEVRFVNFLSPGPSQDFASKLFLEYFVNNMRDYFSKHFNCWKLSWN